MNNTLFFFRLSFAQELSFKCVALVHFMVLGSRAPWAPNTINICWAPEMSWAPIASNFLFEAMGAQLISGAQQILMVLGAQGVQGDQMAEGANGSPGSPDNSGAQTTREPRQLGSPDNSGA